MDPSVQNNNPSNSNYDSLVNGNSNEKNIVQPGQYVAVGDETPAPNTVQSPSAPTTIQPGPKLASSRMPSQGINLQQNSSTPPPTAPPSNMPPPPAAPPSAPPPQNPNQPDPTPFSTQPAAFTPPVATADTGTEKGGKFKKILVLLIIFILIGIIAAIAYIFVLQKNFSFFQSKEEELKTDVSNTVLDEPLPSPQRANEGFSTLPQSTDQAQPPSSIPETIIP